jgi:hypothetical protein
MPKVGEKQPSAKKADDPDAETSDGALVLLSRKD